MIALVETSTLGGVLLILLLCGTVAVIVKGAVIDILEKLGVL